MGFFGAITHWSCPLIHPNFLGHPSRIPIPQPASHGMFSFGRTLRNERTHKYPFTRYRHPFELILVEWTNHRLKCLKNLVKFLVGFFNIYSPTDDGPAGFLVAIVPVIVKNFDLCRFCEFAGRGGSGAAGRRKSQVATVLTIMSPSKTYMFRGFYGK